MSGLVEDRLTAWRSVVTYGGPHWLVDAAPKIVRQLEAELAIAAAAQRGETERLAAEPGRAVLKAHRPKEGT